MTFPADRPTAEELRAIPLGERIYRIRKSLDISQAEVAEAVGVNIKTVNRWENDQADPRRQSRAALEQLTGYPESLFKRKTPPLVPAPVEASAAMAEIGAQLHEQTLLLATLRAAGDEVRGVTTELGGLIGELRGLIGDLRGVIAQDPPPSREQRPA